MHGKLRKVLNFSHSHILQSQWWTCESRIVTDFLSYLSHTTQLSTKLFVTKLNRVRIWNIINVIEIYWRITYKHNFAKYFLSTHICVHICVDLVIPRNFYKVWFALVGFRILLANSGVVKYQNHLIHLVIGFKHDMPCIVRSEALRGNSYLSVHSAQCASCTDWSSWPHHASDLAMHVTSCINPLYNQVAYTWSACESLVGRDAICQLGKK